MSRAPPNPHDVSDFIRIDPEDDDADPVSVIIFDDPDSRIVVDNNDDTWEFAINDKIAYSRWEIGELPEWIEPVLSQIGIRAVRTGQVDV